MCLRTKRSLVRAIRAQTKSHSNSQSCVYSGDDQVEGVVEGEALLVLY